jgi:hypothetical protein
LPHVVAPMGAPSSYYRRRRGGGKRRRRGCCIAARGGARVSAQNFLVWRRRGEEGIRRRHG